ncbi:class I SAM-dependent methyltransferase [Mycolicibacterium sp. 050158]|uniref:class I SAM-dependent methyltransferase n=1 Tax=Mycolicibacterium sp. 050158 TaxID=3090602 RepID=UPI00299F35E5|nr:methyltransferase domain-containing protein [Mycolicibacterium sp. 050158]MDX1892194.1 methyltransferase domain-containing protein [Mycolicibacterium sp. 050158]
MSEPPAPHADRRRAESFGAAADAYDRHRPRYPRQLIEALVTRPGTATLDVGAGTGISSVQLTDAGARVLAVEPDPRMAQVTIAKGIDVEVATFEQWAPAGRSFDLVVFAQSFHWVQPEPALAKVASILTPGGRLALIWNRIVPTSPTSDELNEVYRDYLDEVKRPSIAAEANTVAILQDSGFTVQQRHIAEDRHYPGEEWLDLVFTYSNHLGLPPDSRVELRSRLARRIGDAGVRAHNDALALIATPRARVSSQVSSS